MRGELVGDFGRIVRRGDDVAARDVDFTGQRERDRLPATADFTSASPLSTRATVVRRADGSAMTSSPMATRPETRLLA